MEHPSNPIDLTKEQMEHLIGDTPNTGKRLRQNLLAILGRRTYLVELLSLCRGCEQIRVAHYPRKYCYVTCLPPAGDPVSDLRPEDEADLRLFTSNPTTRTLEATLEHWINRDATDHSLSLTAAYEWQDYMDLNADEMRTIQSNRPLPKGAQAERLTEALARRTSLIAILGLYTHCNQIKTPGSRHKYCYITCRPSSNPNANLHPELETTRRVFDSNPTTRMLGQMLEALIDSK